MSVSASVIATASGLHMPVSTTYVAFAAVVATGISFLASGHLDGLEFVAEHLGFLNEVEPVFSGSPIPDYVIPGIANETLAGILAGVVGLIVTGALLYGLLSAVRQRTAQ